MMLDAFILPCLLDPSSWVDDPTITPHIYLNDKMAGNDLDRSMKLRDKKKVFISILDKLVFLLHPTTKQSEHARKIL
jgi:hypothetical protein